MNEKDCRTYFEEWLTAYSDHLHLVRQSKGVALTQPQTATPAIGVSADQNREITAPQRKPSA
jgi:hypothetical protein